MSPELFKRLLIAWWIFPVAILGVAFISEMYLPDELKIYQETSLLAEATSFDWILLAVSATVIIVLIFGTISLYRFESSGRPLFLWGNVVLILIAPFHGLSIVSGVESALASIDGIFTGVLLASMYLPPLKEKFESPGKDADTEHPVSDDISVG